MPRASPSLDKSLSRVKLETLPFEIALDPPAPVRQHGWIVMEQGEVVHIAHVGRAQNFRHEMIEAVEIEVGEELARQISNRQSATALKWREQIVAL